MLKIFEKPVMTRFVIVGDFELEADKVLMTLEDFECNDEIKGYELDTEVADILATEGVLKKYRGTRMVQLYSKGEKFKSFYQEFKKVYYKNSID